MNGGAGLRDGFGVELNPGRGHALRPGSGGGPLGGKFQGFFQQFLGVLAHEVRVLGGQSALGQRPQGRALVGKPPILLPENTTTAHALGATTVFLDGI